MLPYLLLWLDGSYENVCSFRHHISKGVYSEEVSRQSEVYGNFITKGKKKVAGSVIGKRIIQKEMKVVGGIRA